MCPDFSLPTGLSLTTTTGTISVGNLAPGQERQVSWQVQAAAQSSNKTFTYSVTAGASSTTSTTLQKQISLPALRIADKTPVLFIPGVYGTELYKGETLLWLDPIKAATPGFDRFLDPLMINDNLSPLDTSITIGHVFRRVHMYSLSDVDVKYEDYTEGLIEEFRQSAYEENKDFFTFPELVSNVVEVDLVHPCL